MKSFPTAAELERMQVLLDALQQQSPPGEISAVARALAEQFGFTLPSAVRGGVTGNFAGAHGPVHVLVAGVTLCGVNSPLRESRWVRREAVHMATCPTCRFVEAKNLTLQANTFVAPSPTADRLRARAAALVRGLTEPSEGAPRAD